MNRPTRCAGVVAACWIVLGLVAAPCCLGDEGLAGSRWYLQAFGPVAAPQSAAPATTVCIEFSPDLDRLTGHVGCTCIGARIEVDDANMQIQVQWTTANFCGATQPADPAWFVEALASTDAYTVAGDELRLAYAGALSELVFRKDVSEELAGTGWILETYGDPSAPTPVLPETTITLTVAPDLATVSGFSGCNWYTTHAWFVGPSVELGPTQMTLMACLPAVLTQENAYLTLLGDASSYRLSAEQLVFHGAGGELSFRRDRSADLAGTSWVLVGYGPLDAPLDPTVTVGAAPTLRFAEDLRNVSGNDGLNLFVWTTDIRGERIEILDWQSTMIGCIGDCAALYDLQDQMELGHAERFDFDQGRLVFPYDGGSRRLVYERDWSTDLAGTTWTLETFGEVGDPHPPAAGWAVPVLGFAEDLTSLAGTDGLNMFWADTTFAIGNRMELANWTQTMIGCVGDCDELDAQEDAIHAGLSGTFGVDGDRLTFSYDSGVRQLVYVRDTAARLTRTRWVLDAYGSSAALIDANKAHPFYLEFGDPTDSGVGWTEVFVQGRAYCSAVSATWTLRAGTITGGPIASSTTGAAGCPYTATTAQENAFRDGVFDATSYELQGDTLVVVSSGADVLLFRRDRSPELAGTRWLLQSIGCGCDPASAYPTPVSPFDDPERLGLAFSPTPSAADGFLEYEVEARGCCLGLDGDALVGRVAFGIGSPSLSIQFCDFGAYWERDNQFIAALLMADSYELHDGRLVLGYHEGCERLTFRPDPAGALAGTSWILTGYGPSGVPTSAIPGLGGTLPRLEFAADLKTYGGCGGCNTFSGGELDAFVDEISFGPAWMTLMACEPTEILDQEATFLTLLAAAETFTIRDDGQLVIQYDDSGQYGEMLFDPAP